MNLRREVIGGIINVVPAGTDVSGQPASATVKPTAASGIWSSLGCTQSISFEKDEDTDTDICFNPATGKWEKTEEKIVLADYLDVVVRDHQELVWKLLFGINGDIPSDGTTAVIPFREQIRKIQAWVQFQARSARDNVNRSVFDLWVDMELKAYPGWTEKAAKPELRFKVLASDLNTQLFMANI